VISPEIQLNEGSETSFRFIKLIEAKDDLSVQVHPDNVLANERHQAYGKIEMWHIQKRKGCKDLHRLFSSGDTEQYINALNNNTIQDILSVETAER
jgi:mannose-6-phosphate isomerase